MTSRFKFLFLCATLVQASFADAWGRMSLEDDMTMIQDHWTLDQMDPYLFQAADDKLRDLIADSLLKCNASECDRIDKEVDNLTKVADEYVATKKEYERRYGIFEQRTQAFIDAMKAFKAEEAKVLGTLKAAISQLASSFDPLLGGAGGAPGGDNGDD